MSDNLKIQKFEIIIIKKFCQKIKVRYFCYINCEMQDRPTFGVLSNQGLCDLCSVANSTKNFSETKFWKKKSKFLVYGKTPIIQYSFMEKSLS